MALNYFDFAMMAGALIPVFVVVAACAWKGRDRRVKGQKPPQKEKLLRPAGYSLMLQLDQANERMLTMLVMATLFCSLAGASTSLASKALSFEIPFQWRVIALALPAGFTLIAVACALATYRTIDHARRLKLGLRGEQATAEALHEASDAGYRAFHDLQPDGDWNIDHVVVGTKGVFLVETKARCRRGASQHLAEHEVKFDGSTLEFPFGADRTAAVQARKNSQWLAQYLTKKTGEPVNVDAIVALPGWWVDDNRGGQVRAMNCSYLTKYLRHQEERLGPAQVQRIVTALEEKNRTLEFW